MIVLRDEEQGYFWHHDLLALKAMGDNYRRGATEEEWQRVAAYITRLESLALLVAHSDPVYESSMSNLFCIFMCGYDEFDEKHADDCPWSLANGLHLNEIRE
jgi:hypothetical protein